MRPGEMVKQACLLVLALFVARADAGYVGSRMCSGCHRAIYEAYQKTAMGGSMSAAAQSAPLENAAETVRSDKLDRTFSVYRQGSEVWQSESQFDAAGNTVFRSAHKLEYAVGSGVNGYSFLVRRGSYLFQAPLSYYARTRQWDLSPGYESADMGFNRIVAPACLVCH